MPRDESLKAGGQDADDGDRAPVDVEGSSDGRRIPMKMLFPIVVTDQRLVRSRPAPRDVIRISEHSAEVRAQLKHAEAVACHQGAAHSRHGPVFLNGEVGAVPSQDVAVHCLVPAKRIVGGPGERKIRRAFLAKRIAQ